MKHGTRSSYINQGCRCAACREANARALREWRAARSAADVPQHGLAGNFDNYGCRCVPCLEAVGRLRALRRARGKMAAGRGVESLSPLELAAWQSVQR